MEDMAMLLPQGILKNTREIYEEVASHHTVPPENLWHLWRVYATTSRALVDPTALRLEHFWWHVWGSNKRSLSGPTLAKLFEELSNGPTFVPLRSTRNRYEGPSDPGSKTREHGRSEPKVASRQGQPNQNAGQQRSAPVGGMKLPTPSSSRPPPSHPILKKTRGPCGSRPRPTARFADPSAFEEIIISPLPESIAPQLSSSPQGRQVTNKDNTVVAVEEMPPRPKPAPSVVDMRPPPKPSPRSAELVPPPNPPPKRKSPPSSVVVATGTERPPPISPAKSERAAAPTARRSVAVTVPSKTASKRRSAIPRKQSSQSSGATGTRIVSPATAAGVKPGVAQTSKAQAGTGNQDCAILSSSEESQGVGDVPVISAKSAGKRPAKDSSNKRGITQSVAAPPNRADGQHDRPPLPAEVKLPPLLPPQVQGVGAVPVISAKAWRHRLTKQMANTIVHLFQQKRGSHPKGYHPKYSHLQGSHPKYSHLQGSHPKGSHPKYSHLQGSHPKGSHPKYSHLQGSHPEWKGSRPEWKGSPPEWKGFPPEWKGSPPSASTPSAPTTKAPTTSAPNPSHGPLSTPGAPTPSHDSLSTPGGSPWGPRKPDPMGAALDPSTDLSLLQRSETVTAPRVVRARSNNSDDQLTLVALPTGIRSVVATTNTTARGQFDNEPMTPEPWGPEVLGIPHDPVLAPRFTRTLPNPVTPPRFGRSRSELTLLLEREKNMLLTGHPGMF
ncbi:hypothetical protein B0T21DRAFT_414170 [Apiosordaria backusii]|uniref:Nitrogen regulatory protein areA GATA-like domain-containing protein n=1 Tax=Apiosordaria backusii TaxID=314023 RepID=A0AA40AXF0_9PEZI|nr:hypothetical protein B0T21DRAFT_414170 [Apiosordaria backusii]